MKSSESAAELIAKRLVVSEYAVVSWRAARLEITATNSGTKFVTDNFDLLRVLHAFAEPRMGHEVVREFAVYGSQQIVKCICELIEAEVLVEPGGPELAIQHHWDQQALSFHWSSRRPDYYRNLRRSSAAAVVDPASPVIPLVPGSTVKERDLIDVLDARRSWRSWPGHPIGFDAFSSFLWLSARNRTIAQEAIHNSYVSRPYPSGGAAYSLELYPIIGGQAVESLTAGLYRYLPMTHSLQRISEKHTDYLPFLEAAGRSAGTSAVPVVLVITSRFARQSEVYGRLAYSLVLKEVGCLFQTFYLVGEYLGLAPCALGGGAPVGTLARLCNTTELAEPVVGEFMIGPR